MRPTKITPDRVHLIAHAGPPAKDIRRLGFASATEYLAFVQKQLPGPLRLTYTTAPFEVAEDEWHGGRSDDDARVRDLQGALDDPRTLAIVAANGGAYFLRILPQLDFSRLARRRTPLWALGFSEMTSLVNIVASYRCGRGVYWLCPNYLAWKIRPQAEGRAAFAEFWRVLPEVLADRMPRDVRYLDFGPIRGELVSGKVRPGPVRLIGGCLSVLAAMLPGPLGRRLRPDGRWLFLEDVKEPPYRIDRYLATLKLAGWFDRVAGVLLGDFHLDDKDAQSATVELLTYHLPRRRNIPVVTTRSFGHLWPLVPVHVGRPVRLRIAGPVVEFTSPGLDAREKPRR